MAGVRDDIEALMKSCNFLEGAPFDWVTVALRYGIHDEEEPRYSQINSEYGDLPLSIEIDSRPLAVANPEEMRRLLEVATLRALISVGQKFNLCIAPLVARLQTR